MKYLRISAILALSVTLLTGCDFFRSMLGKPTSKDIEALRVQQEARRKAADDSIAAAKAAQAQIKAAQEAEKAELTPTFRYYVILGSFKEFKNAKDFAELLTLKGFAPQQFEFENGFRAVGVCGTDNPAQAYSKMWDFYGEPFLGNAEPWVYDVKTMKL